MRMSAGELLDEIEAAGGSLEVQPDRCLECRNIPPNLRDELVRLQFVIAAILLGECEPRPFQLMDKKKLKKLVMQVRDEGGKFRRTGHFFECMLPDALADLRDTIIEHAVTIYEVIAPKKPSSSQPKRHCEICPSGSGCRVRGMPGQRVDCPNCGHACRCHFFKNDLLEESTDGCGQWLQPFEANPDFKVRCLCPGWPPDAALLKRQQKRAAEAAKFRLALAAAGQEQEATTTLLPTQTQGVKP